LETYLPAKVDSSLLACESRSNFVQTTSTPDVLGTYHEVVHLERILGVASHAAI
jgi:hypothetical protein